MGKIRKRVKYNHRNIKPHTASNKNDGVQDHEEDETSVMDIEDGPASDRRSTVYSTSSRMSVNNITKKEKRQIKKENWARRIEAYYTSRKEEVMAAKRKQTPVIGDMQPLQMALPTLEEIVQQSQKNLSNANSEGNGKLRGKMKKKKRQKQLAQDMKTFSQVLAHPAFSDDPVSVIKNHLLAVNQAANQSGKNQ